MEENYVKELFEKLQKQDSVTSEELSIPKNMIHGILISLESKEQITFTISEKISKYITDEGKEILSEGSPEYKLFNSIPDGGLDSSVVDKNNPGSSYAFRNRWIKSENDKIFRNKENVEDEVVKLLENFNLLKEKEFNELKKRKLVEQTKTNVYIIKKGPNFGMDECVNTELTADMVLNYKGEIFKKYNFNSVGNIPSCGALHPLMKIREEIRRIFLEMGFNEMMTNEYVESSFWNFDSLFQPQNHPSRDAHDTFFIKSPEFTETFEQEYFEKVKEIHSKGGYGSIGHQTEWDPKEAMKNILRTHTTAVSSKYLKSMAKDFVPIKLFSIDKVFRNESIDATHLAEFHQVEGLIAGYDIGLRDLMGFLKTFFEKLGLKDIKFKPAFNPYTEPSMEVFGYHEGLKRWIEIGNSGVFRPEMLRPMGYDEDVVVIAWGLSVERPAMIKYGLNNIRDLVGHKVDINFIKKSEFIYF